MRENYEKIIWETVTYLDQIHQALKELAIENKNLHERLKYVELVLSRLVSKQPIK